MADLIDRAALLADIDELHEHCGHCDGYGYISKDKAMEKVKAAPAVDAKPVVHGEWDFIGDYDSRCSVCGEEYCIGPNEDYNFCPNCGADMRGET